MPREIQPIEEDNPEEPLTLQDVIISLLGPHAPGSADMDFLYMVADLKKQNPGAIPTELFFRFALNPWYESGGVFACGDGYEGLDLEVGHILYRLSDYIPLEQRQNISVHPVGPIDRSDEFPPEGSILRGGWRWHSLEDWRQQWEKYNSPIPEFRGLLPEAGPQLEYLFREEQTDS